MAESIKEFKPYVPAESLMKEFTPRAIILGGSQQELFLRFPQSYSSAQMKPEKASASNIFLTGPILRWPFLVASWAYS
jgi:hypothetical protein